MSDPMSNDPSFSKVHVAGIALIIVAAGTITTLWATQRSSRRHEAEARAQALAAGPRVRTTVVGAEGGERAVVVQGEAAPYVSTTVFAKVAGFLRDVRVDKGSLVRAGQVLAVLESPEVDRDTQALREDAENKQRNAERSRALAKQGILSSRDLEDAETQYRIAREKLASQTVVQGYRTVTAPFSGVVTQRFADPGAMIQNGGSTSTAQPLVSLAQVDRLRATFYLDQSVASRVKAGTEVEIRPAERPEIARTVKVARIGGALDPRTRTLLVEADLDNRDQAFLAGGFIQVSLKLQEPAGQLAVPPEALTLREGKPCVAVVGPDQKVRLQTVKPGEEATGRVRILQGLKAGDRLVLNPAAELKDGDRVQVAG